MAGFPTRYELRDYMPAADPRATVVVGDARFTVLTDRLLRMEYRGAVAFEDRPTLAFVHRRQPVPPFEWDVAEGALTTGHLRLRYIGGPFSAESLWVEPAPAALPSRGAFAGWRLSQTSGDDPLNLRGTIRTLDKKNNVSLKCNGGGGGGGSRWVGAGFDPSDHCAWGVVSRSGWAL
eukprot:scaffold7535_cov138-Isochrysis_galbana.AAC.4